MKKKIYYIYIKSEKKLNDNSIEKKKEEEDKLWKTNFLIIM